MNIKITIITITDKNKLDTHKIGKWEIILKEKFEKYLVSSSQEHTNDEIKRKILHLRQVKISTRKL